MSITETKDFKSSLHCLDCVYEDLGYNGKMLCQPRTKQCQPIFSYDLAMQSKIRKHEAQIRQGFSEQHNRERIEQTE